MAPLTKVEADRATTRRVAAEFCFVSILQEPKRFCIRSSDPPVPLPTADWSRMPAEISMAPHCLAAILPARRGVGLFSRLIPQEALPFSTALLEKMGPGR